MTGSYPHLSLTLAVLVENGEVGQRIGEAGALIPILTALVVISLVILWVTRTKERTR